MSRRPSGPPQVLVHDAVTRMTEAVARSLPPQLFCSACDWNTDLDTFPAALGQMVAHIRLQHGQKNPLSSKQIRALRRAWEH